MTCRACMTRPYTQQTIRGPSEELYLAICHMFISCCILTAWNFTEVDELWMAPLCAASRVVGVLVTFMKPWVVVTLEAGRVAGTRLHTCLQRLEFAEQLSSTVYIESLVDCNDLHYIQDHKGCFYNGFELRLE